MKQEVSECGGDLGGVCLVFLVNSALDDLLSECPATHHSEYINFELCVFRPLSPLPH
jgi:hypothetical protein